VDVRGPSPEALAFHVTLDGYAPTPLVDLPALAAELGVGHILAKDESSRLGLPAFKALGASWAIHRALRARADGAPVTVVTATDGNHGRAVARFARLLGQRASIWVPDGVHPDAVQAIRDEGAQVTATGGSYDEAVAAAARAAQADEAVLVQDTSWDGYEQIPTWIVEGYTTLFTEIDAQLAEAGLGSTDLLVVPVGVGSLLQAALAHYRRTGADPGPAVISVEPVTAACIAASLESGHPVTVDTGVTVMAGLNCGTPSSLAWPYIERGLDAAVAVTVIDGGRRHTSPTDSAGPRTMPGPPSQPIDLPQRLSTTRRRVPTLHSRPRHGRTSSVINDVRGLLVRTVGQYAPRSASARRSRARP
jgi:diaminopropionate ammonia-lyase